MSNLSLIKYELPDGRIIELPEEERDYFSANRRLSPQEVQDLDYTIDLLEREGYKQEIYLIEALERKKGWNPFHAEKVAGQAWQKVYGEEYGGEENE